MTDLESLCIKFHGFINKRHPHGQHYIHSFNFLEWIKWPLGPTALLCQASGLSYLLSADLSQ